MPTISCGPLARWSRPSTATRGQADAERQPRPVLACARRAGARRRRRRAARRQDVAADADQRAEPGVDPAPTGPATREVDGQAERATPATDRRPGRSGRPGAGRAHRGPLAARRPPGAAAAACPASACSRAIGAPACSDAEVRLAMAVPCGTGDAGRARAQPARRRPTSVAVGRHASPSVGAASEPGSRASVRRSGLHDDGHDHRPAPGALADELAGGPAHVALERLDVAHALGERRARPPRPRGRTPRRAGPRPRARTPSPG